MADSDPNHPGDTIGNSPPSSQDTIESSQSSFRPLMLRSGEILARRFRILRFLARGGMGEVYEAEDLALHERIALKTIAPELSADERYIERFKREIQLAHKVTHPNVCRTFDLFYDSRPAESGAFDIAFLTMELLQGESLSACIARKGKLTPAEALPLLRQMADGLAAAHRVGIIHRDFKSANVFLVTDPASPESVRAVITDFGLARAEMPAGHTLTASDDLVGTPAYLAPEQIEGGEITKAVDIYAFGVVMYEMMTGHLPFVGDTRLAAALKRLKESPPAPSTYSPELKGKWDATILCCLERQPSRRFATASAIVDGLSGVARLPRSSRRSRFVYALPLLLILLLTGFMIRYRWHRTPGGGGSVSSPLPRRAVAVLGFNNVSGRAESAWLSTALSEELTTELAAGEKIRTIPEENVARMKTELGVLAAASLAPDTLQRIHQNLGTDLVVLGSYADLGEKSGGRMRLDVRLQDATNGETLAAVSETGTEGNLFELVSRAGAVLREKLGIGAVSGSESDAVQASLPSGTEAARLYSLGLEKLRIEDNVSARELLQRAVTADPQFALAHSALAEAWSTMGYDKEAQDESKKAFDLSGSLPREQRLLVEARYREYLHDMDAAIRIYSGLFAFFPDNIEYGLKLASSQYSAAKYDEAMQTIHSLRRLASPLAGDPRIELLEGSIANSQGDIRRAIAAEDRAASAAEARGAKFVSADARLTQCWDFLTVGETDKGIAACNQARTIFEAIGDRSQIVRSDIYVARALADQGKVVDALNLIGQAQEIVQKTGNKLGLAVLLQYGGNFLRLQGELSKAAASFERAAFVSREIRRKDLLASALDSSGVTNQLLGELVLAEKALRESLSLARETGNQYNEAHALDDLGGVLMDEGRLAEAERAYEDALAAWSKVGDEPEVANQRVALSSLQLEQGRGSDGEKVIRQACDQFRNRKQADNEISADAVLVRVLLARRQTAEAQKVIEEGKAILPGVAAREIRFSFAVAEAQVLAASGHAAQARQLLQQILSEEARYGYVGSEFEARLALSQVELSAGNRALARSDLRVLQQEAQARGFRLIARKAAAAGSL